MEKQKLIQTEDLRKNMAADGRGSVRDPEGKIIHRSYNEINGKIWNTLIIMDDTEVTEVRTNHYQGKFYEVFIF